MLKKIIIIFIFFAISFSVVIFCGYAEDNNPLRKFSRGLVNLSVGWLEIPRQMVKVKESSGDIAGLFLGPLKGFAYTVGRMVVGAYEIGTFLVPPYRKVIEPEFIFSDREGF